MNLVIVIPFYNEEKRIRKADFHQIFSGFPHYGFLLVDDGSSDQTPLILDQFQAEFGNVEVLQLQKNSGKAEAIRCGVLSIPSADFIAYYDADLATPFSELDRLIDCAMADPKLKLVMGARIKLIGNGVKRSLKRHYFGRIFATIVSQFVLKVPVYDTQCGAKVIEYKVAVQIFKEPFVSRWLFDVELLKRLQKIDDLNQVVKEFPLEHWQEIGQTKIKFSDFLRIPFQLIQIYRKYD